MNIILASESQRRKQLLEKLKINFTISKANIDESKFINSTLNPVQICTKLAYLKAKKISSKKPNDIIIGADTIVIINDEILGKPVNSNDAFNMLSKLNARTHYVLTAVSIQCQKKKIKHTFYDKTYVTFNKISNKNINYYIDNYKPFDKSGSYGIQDWSSIFVKKIDGCFYNVVGLPISKFYSEFHKLGFYFSL